MASRGGSAGETGANRPGGDPVPSRPRLDQSVSSAAAKRVVSRPPARRAEPCRESTSVTGNRVSGAAAVGTTHARARIGLLRSGRAAALVVAVAGALVGGVLVWQAAAPGTRQPTLTALAGH